MSDPINWNESQTPPPPPEMPVAKFKVGDIVPSWYLTPHVVLGVRLQVVPNSDYDTGWDGTPKWEYSLWKWVKDSRFGTYSYHEWGWVEEEEILKIWDQFQTRQQEKKPCVDPV